MNNDLIERIARAIFNDDPQWDRFPPEYRAKYIQQARAALTAMQGEAGKPTEAMIDLAERAIEEWFATHDGEEIDCRALARIAVTQGEVGGLREAANNLLERMFDTMSNGKGIEATDGEKCWIVHSDEIEELRAALAASPPVDQGRIERLKAPLPVGVRELWPNMTEDEIRRKVQTALTNKGANP